MDGLTPKDRMQFSRPNYPKEESCCLIGQGIIPKGQRKEIEERAEFRIRKLYARGVVFYATGGMGDYDAMISQLLFRLRDSELPEIRVTLLCAPKLSRGERTTYQQRENYRKNYTKYDKIVRMMDMTEDEDFYEWNRRIVDASKYCMAYCPREDAHVFEIVQYAKSSGAIVYDMSKKEVRHLKSKRLRIITWNLNGLLSCLKSKSFEPVKALSPDILCCQETRTKQNRTVLDGYQHYRNPSKRDGFHGTMTVTSWEPVSVIYGLGNDELDAEGRVITLEYPNVFIVNAYAPMSQTSLKRQEVRLRWDAAFREYVCGLDERKPVIMCGDFNVARLPIDIFPENMRQYWERQGYASDEAANLETLLEAGFLDAFRVLYPDREGCYTWWSNRLNRRTVDRGWRLDYFFISERLRNNLVDVRLHPEIEGSDHCPVELIIKL